MPRPTNAREWWAGARAHSMAPDSTRFRFTCCSPGVPRALPGSHRTGRDIVPQLRHDFYLIIPDQRGVAASDRPQEVEAYTTDALVGDIFALADALAIERFALVGHDWGGAISWPAALRGDPRLIPFAVINAPHPVVFHIRLIRDPPQPEAATI